MLVIDLIVFFYSFSFVIQLHKLIESIVKNQLEKYLRKLTPNNKHRHYIKG